MLNLIHARHRPAGFGTEFINSYRLKVNNNNNNKKIKEEPLLLSLLLIRIEIDKVIDKPLCIMQCLVFKSRLIIIRLKDRGQTESVFIMSIKHSYCNLQLILFY